MVPGAIRAAAGSLLSRGLLLGAFMSGCAPYQQPAADTGPRGAVAAPPPPLAGAQVMSLHSESGLIGYPGANPVATRAYLAALRFGDSAVTERYNCTNCVDGVSLRIAPALSAHTIDWRMVVRSSGPGHIVAKVRNVDQRAFSDWNLAPGDSAYLWVGAIDATGTRGVGYYRINSDGTAAPPLAWRHHFRFCGHSTVRTLPAARRRNIHTGCTVETIRGAASASSFFDRNTRAWTAIPVSYTTAAPSAIEPYAPQDGVMTGVWVSCSGGCCEVDEAS